MKMFFNLINLWNLIYYFFSKLFFQIICECHLYTGFYGMTFQYY